MKWFSNLEFYVLVVTKCSYEIHIEYATMICSYVWNGEISNVYRYLMLEGHLKGRE
jgi:hypothetical protein